MADVVMLPGAIDGGCKGGKRWISAEAVLAMRVGVGVCDVVATISGVLATGGGCLVHAIRRLQLVGGLAAGAPMLAQSLAKSCIHRCSPKSSPGFQVLVEVRQARS